LLAPKTVWGYAVFNHTGYNQRNMLDLFSIDEGTISTMHAGNRRWDLFGRF
jgi:hypothetical protein